MVDQDAMATEVVALIDGLALQTFAELDGNVQAPSGGTTRASLDSG